MIGREKEANKLIFNKLTYSERSSRSVKTVKAVVLLKNLAKFTGEYLCWSLFFNKVAPVAASD